MNDLFRTVAAPLTIPVDGKEWRFHPMTIGDWAELDAWAETEVFAGMKRRLELLPANAGASRQKLLDRIALITRSELEAEMRAVKYGASGAAAVRRALLMLRHEHPKVTEEEARKLVSVLDFQEVEMRLEGSSGSMNADLLLAVKRVVSAKADRKDVEQAEAALSKAIEKAAKETEELRRPFDGEHGGR